MDTIFALASAQGKAGVAIVRVSGPMAHPALEILSGPAVTLVVLKSSLNGGQQNAN